MAVVVGIDPGVQPVMARIDSGGAVDFNEDTSVNVKRGATKKREPEPRLIANILRRWAPDLVIVERVTGRPGESVAAVGSFMRARGMLEGVCAGLGIPCELVAPNVWSRDMKLRKGDDAGRLRALELMPALAQALATKSSHNRADAFLLALWGRQFIVPGHPLLS